MAASGSSRCRRTSAKALTAATAIPSNATLLFEVESLAVY